MEVIIYLLIIIIGEEIMKLIFQKQMLYSVIMVNFKLFKNIQFNVL
jgi:hypothetical protein